jgi:DnaK suppressor protein
LLGDTRAVPADRGLSLQLFVLGRRQSENVARGLSRFNFMKSVAKSKLQNYRKLLQKKADELRRSMSAQAISQLVSRQDHVPDEGDLSQQSHEEWIFLNRNTLDMKLLREVQDALRRFDAGSYGVCHQCDEPISIKRLDAVPWARYCVACQEQIALRAANGADTLEDDYQEAGR